MPVETPVGPLQSRLIYDEVGFAATLTLTIVSSLIVFRPRSAPSHWA